MSLTKNILKVLALQMLAGSAFAQDAERPQSHTPMLTYEVPQIVRDINKPDTFRPGVVEFEWANKPPLTRAEDKGEQSETQYDTHIPQKTLDDNPFEFETPKPVTTVEEETAEEKVDTQKQQNQNINFGEQINVAEGIIPDVFWVENNSGNPKEFTIHIPNNSRKTTLILGSNGLINWNIRTENGTSLDGVLLFGRMAQSHNLTVTSKTPTRPNVLRRSDLGQRDYKSAVPQNVDSQPMAVVSQEHNEITLVP